MGAYAPQTIIECLEHWARHRGQRRAFTFLDTSGQAVASLSFFELLQKAQTLAGRLDARGLQGEHIALMYRPGLDFIEAFLGCLYAEVVPVPIHPARRSRDYDKMRGILGRGSVKRILTDRPTLHTLRRSGHLPEWLAGENLVVTDELSQAATTRRLGRPCAEQLAMLQYTSGSTLAPKGVMLTHRNLLGDLRMLAKATSINEDDVYACWLPHYHDLGLIAHLLASLYSGCHCIILAPASFTSRPLVWLEAISKYRVSVSGAPNFAYRYCVDKIRREDCRNLRLDCWKLATVSAEPIRYADLVAFVSMFGEFGIAMSALTPGYGLAEASVFVACGARGQGPQVLELDAKKLKHGVVTQAAAGGRTFVGSGYPSDEQEVVVVDPETRAVLPQGRRVGEVCVAGENIMKGYWDRSEDTDETLVTLPNRPGRVFLRTGDLGFLDERSNLFITGRIKDQIIVRGVNYYPQDLEETVESRHADLRSGGTAAFAQEGEDAETVVVVSELGRQGLKSAREDPAYAGELASSMSDAIAEAFEIAVDRIVFLKPGGAVRTSSGKISRRGCKKALLGGELDQVAQWRRSDAVPRTGDSVERNLHANLEFARALDVGGFTAFATVVSMLATTSDLSFSEIDLSHSIFFYGVDSLKIAEIHGAVEAKVGCDLSPVTFFRSNSLKGLIEDIEREIKEGPEWLENESRFHADVTKEWYTASALGEAGREVMPHDADLDMGAVILTGAAGFLGGYLLHELLERTRDDVYCLVRAGNEDLGMQRIVANASSYGLDVVPHLERIHAVIGDISKPYLGLSDAEYSRLSAITHQVFHCAAIDNFYLPYESLRPTNVQGVKNVAEFAAARRTKPLFHASSCAAALFDDGPERFEPGGLNCGYSQTKYVGERLVRSLIANGYPATYYRIGYLYSRGRRPVHNEEVFETVLESMYYLNCVPEIDVAFDLTSVEYVAKSMVDTAQNPISERRGSYTLYNPRPLKWRELLEQFRAARPGIRSVSLAVFQEKFRAYVMGSTEKRLSYLRSAVNHELVAQINAMFQKVVPDVFEHNIHLCPPCDYEFSGNYLKLVLDGVRTPSVQIAPGSTTDVPQCA